MYGQGGFRDSFFYTLPYLIPYFIYIFYILGIVGIVYNNNCYYKKLKIKRFCVFYI
jgi:hypothetical protein